MGTDIHGRLQVRYRSEMPYNDVGGIEDDRNYRVFAMLAGVRNGYGFGGIKTHEPLAPISDPRGLPDDLVLTGGDSITLSGYKDDEPVEFDYWLGDHSHSWLTLSEIIAWDGWNKPLNMEGYLNAEEFSRIEREGGSPDSWCGWVSGGGVVIVTPEEARAGAAHSHVHCAWSVPFIDYTGSFKAWIDYCEKKYGHLLKDDPAAVRIVFGFDS